LTRSRVARAVLCAALLAGPARAEEPPSVLLGRIEVAGAEGIAPGAPLRATLELNDARPAKVASVREWFPRAAASGERVALVLEGRAPASARRPSPAQRGATFLVDFDRPDAAPFREEVARTRGAPNEELARLVDRWIDRKSMSRGIDPASRVAVRREGDCTEHAVLLAAAARLAGRAARVVLGIALVPVDGRLAGFGHAWTEIHDGAAWRTFDATPLPPGVRYLPLGTFADEGPGYLAAAWAALSPLDVRRVVLEAAPPR
jgi:transglutaminase-like putative cysteine protease